MQAEYVKGTCCVRKIGACRNIFVGAKLGITGNIRPREMLRAHYTM